MRSLHPLPLVFAAEKLLSQRPKGVSAGGLRAEPGEAENGQNALVACLGVLVPHVAWGNGMAELIDGGRS